MHISKPSDSINRVFRHSPASFIIFLQPYLELCKTTTAVTPRLCRRTPSSARERAIFSAGKDGCIDDRTIGIGAPSLTTGHAGPHPAVRLIKADEELFGMVQF